MTEIYRVRKSEIDVYQSNEPQNIMLYRKKFNKIQSDAEPTRAAVNNSNNQINKHKLLLEILFVD